MNDAFDSAMIGFLFANLACVKAEQGKSLDALLLAITSGLCFLTAIARGLS